MLRQEKIHSEPLTIPGQQESPTQHPVSMSWTRFTVVIEDDRLDMLGT